MSQPILIVDDSRVARRMLRTTFESAGHHVYEASGVEEALQILSQHEIQIVVSDWVMAGMSGPDLCRIIRKENRDRYVYIILITAKDTCDSRLEGFAAGADDFVGKPYDSALLLSRIKVAERVVSLESAEVTIFALAKLAESRDPDTGRHLERVQRYCHILAIACHHAGIYRDQIDAQFIRLVHDTAPLHDIGKVAIPDSILLKAGKLTPDEYTLMKRHTFYGAETLSAALAKRPGTRFLAMARDIAAHHHEHWNGRGYPDGLKGEDIPLAARIVAVADVYDALSSHRVYKPAMPHSDVRQYLVEQSGRHFDPHIIQAFLSVEQSFIDISSEFRDLPFLPRDPIPQAA